MMKFNLRGFRVEVDRFLLDSGFLLSYDIKNGWNMPAVRMFHSMTSSIVSSLKRDAFQYTETSLVL